MNDEIDKEVPLPADNNPTDETATERKPDRKPDSREVLNELRQSVVVALLSQGFSRRTAARHVGVSHTSIARAAARDPKFAKKLSDAESVADFSILRTVRDAARQEKYWRAAAWLLERRLPDEFGHRPPHSFSGDQVMAVLAEVFSYALPALKDDQKDQFMRSFNGTLRDVEAAVQHADRWRDLAADDSGVAQCAADNSGAAALAADDAPLRSPYEHPDWYEPAAAGHAGDAAAAMASNGSRRNGHAVPAEAGTTSAPNAPAEAGTTSARNVPAEAATTSAAGDVCQSSQKGGRHPVNRIRRKLLAANGLGRPSRSVPNGIKSRGGTDNGNETRAAIASGPSPVGSNASGSHSGNGAKH